MKRLLALLLSVCVTPAFASDLVKPAAGSATVTLVQGEDSSGIQKLALTGDLDDTTIDRLNAFSYLKGTTGVIVYLNSYGGRLNAGLALGRRIRELGFSTQVGSPRAALEPDQPAYCESACVFALAGGRFRLAQPNSKVGVHQFASASQMSTQEAMVKAQAASAMTVDYLISMGIDPALFTLMAATPSDSIQLLSVQQQFDLRLVNGGNEQAQWAFQSTKLGGLILVGEQAAISTRTRVELACNTDNGVSVAAIVSAGSRTPAITRSVENYQLLLGNDSYPVSDETVRQGGLNTRVDFSGNSQIERMGLAQSIGVSLHTREGLTVRFFVDTQPSQGLIRSFLGMCKGDRPRLQNSL